MTKSHQIQVKSPSDSSTDQDVGTTDPDPENANTGTRPGAQDNKPETNFAILDTIKTYLEGYFDNTTVHGFKYILIGESWFERIAWIFCVIFGFTCAFILIGIYIDEAVSNPIAISLSTIPVKDIPFPAVTIDAGQQWDIMGYPRKALDRVHPDENNPGIS